MSKPRSRANGEGSIYRRGNVWEAQIIIGWKFPNNDITRPKQPIKVRKSGFATKREAAEYLHILREKKTGRSQKAPDLTYYWKVYSEGEIKKLSKSKSVAYGIAWKRLEDIQLLPVDQITVQTLRDTVSKKCKTYYPAKDCKNLLSALFKLAGADGYVDKTLPSYIILPELEEKEREIFTEEEQKSLWKLYESGNLDAAIPLFMLYSGAMPGETMRLRVEQIDLDKQQIVGAGLKTKTRRSIPIMIADCMVPVLKDLIDNAQPSGFLWPQNETAWYERYYSALEQAKCRRLQPYVCRHGTASALAVSENIAPATIRRIMRWSTTKMLDRYAHPSTGDALAGVNAIKKNDSDTTQQE